MHQREKYYKSWGFYNQLKNNVYHTVKSNGYDEDLADMLLNAYDYMINNNFRGGCHALSCVLYIAMKEMDLSPSLYIGECDFCGLYPFDHSWITLGGKVIDLAIFMPLTGIGTCGGPIVFNEDMISLMEAKVNYGIHSDEDFSAETKFAINTPLARYMDDFPYAEGGLWTVLQNDISVYDDLDIDSLRNKYKNEKRILC